MYAYIAICRHSDNFQSRVICRHHSGIFESRLHCRSARAIFLYMLMWNYVLLYLRKQYFNEYEYDYVNMIKHRYVIHRCCLLCETLLEHDYVYTMKHRYLMRG